MLLRFLVIFSFLKISTHKTIEIPPTYSQIITSLRLNQIQQIERPSFQFQNIYKRQVYNSTQLGVNNISVCSETPSQVIFKTINTFIRHVIEIKKPVIVYNFQQLKKSRKILDLIYDNKTKTIITILNNGVLQTMQINIQSNRFSNYFSLGTGFNNLKAGKLIQISSNYYFFNADVAFLFDPSSKKISVLKGYNKCQGFQQVLVINKVDSSILAIADRQKGVYFYSLKGKNMTILNYITNMSFPNSKLSLQDIQFNTLNNNLFVLDQTNGIFVFQLTFNDNSLNYKLLSKKINKKACNIMHLDIENQFLYLACNQASKINLKQWPVYTEKLIPHPLISIQQIITTPNNLLGLVGNNVFRLFYLDRPVDYFEDDMLDKLIFIDGIAITSNQNYISALNYQVIPPKILCQTSDSKLLGNTQLMLKTTAQCNLTYLKEIKYSEVELSEDDICIYTTFQDLYIWQPWHVKISQIKFALYLILGLLVITLVMYLMHRRRMRKLEIMLYDLDLSKNEPNQLIQQKVEGIISFYKQQKKQDQCVGVDSQKNIAQPAQSLP